MYELGDPEISAAVLLAIGVALLLSFVFTQQARTRAARFREIRRLQSVAAEEARREEEEALAEYSSMAATQDLHCSVCSKPSMTRCSRCKAVRYCSSKCQMRHWKDGHKYECRPGESVPSSGSSSNGSRNFSDIGSSSDSPRSGSDTGPFSIEPLSKPAEKSRAEPVLNENGTTVKPKTILFPYDSFVKYFNWSGSEMPPCGLLNSGNSCFANVIFQCLTHTRPLIAYLLEGTHGEECSRSVSGEWCLMCSLQDHVWRAKTRQSPISASHILSRMQNIGNLGHGRQEDAHEFMRFAIDSLQSTCLDKAGGEKSVDPRSQETTLIHHTFGGRLQSKVTCTECLQVTHRYENMMDLAVEIQGLGFRDTLEDALAQFTAPEWLDGENKYKCERCKTYVRARKRLSLHEAPNVLTIALKRFQKGRFGKLNKQVIFPEILDMSPYMSGKGDVPPLYSLYAVVVHVDMLNASFFGHYICYVKDSQGVWYKIDDSKVKEVDLETVMAQRAYMLFYTRSCVRPCNQAGDYVDGSSKTRTKSKRSKKFLSNVYFGRPYEYLGNAETRKAGGLRGLPMGTCNQVDCVDGSPETQTVSEQSISNGELSALQQSELGRIRSNDDEIESEDFTGLYSNSNSFSHPPVPPPVPFDWEQEMTEEPRLRIADLGFRGRDPNYTFLTYDELCNPPRPRYVEQPCNVEQLCNVEQPCNSIIVKWRLEDGLSPLPSPIPLDTDQLPAWPLGSQGSSNACVPPGPQSLGTPISCSCLTSGAVSGFVTDPRAGSRKSQSGGLSSESSSETSKSSDQRTARGVQADNDSVADSNGLVYAVDKLQPEKLRNSRSIPKPLFAPGFLNKARYTPFPFDQMISLGREGGIFGARGQ